MPVDEMMSTDGIHLWGKIQHEFLYAGLRMSCIDLLSMCLDLNSGLGHSKE